MTTSRFRPLLLSLALAAVACGGGSGGGGGGAGGGAATKAASGPREVVIARPEAVAYRRTLELGGTLEPAERVEIAARVEGALIDVTAELGDTVTRGQTLARITREDFAARLAQTDAELAQARTELTRVEALTAGELAPRQELEQARTKVEVAESQRALAGRQLRDTRVLAPFDGAIAERLVSPGAFVRIGTPLFVLVSSDPLRLAIDVPERHAHQLAPGTPVRVHGEAGEVDARISRMAPIVDPESRTRRAEVEVAGGGPLIPGMYVRARIDLGAIDGALRLPRAAVFDVLGRARVVEVVEGRAQPRDVELIGEEEGVAIVRGLDPGAVVVARSPGLLAPGAEVRARADEGEAEAAATPTSPSGGT